MSYTRFGQVLVRLENSSGVKVSVIGHTHKMLYRKRLMKIFILMYYDASMGAVLSVLHLCYARVAF